MQVQYECWHIKTLAHRLTELYYLNFVDIDRRVFSYTFCDRVTLCSQFIPFTFKANSHAVTRFSRNKCIENALTLLFNVQRISYPGGSMNFQHTFIPAQRPQLAIHF